MLEQLALSAMVADVARIEQLPSARLNEKRISVKCRMVDQVRSDLERPDVERFPVRQFELDLGNEGMRNERSRSREDPLRRSPHGQRDVRSKRCKAPMVHVPV